MSSGEDRNSRNQHENNSFFMIFSATVGEIYDICCKAIATYLLL